MPHDLPPILLSRSDAIPTRTSSISSLTQRSRSKKSKATKHLSFLPPTSAAVHDMFSNEPVTLPGVLPAFPMEKVPSDMDLTHWKSMGDLPSVLPIGELPPLPSPTSPLLSPSISSKFRDDSNLSLAPRSNSSSKISGRRRAKSISSNEAKNNIRPKSGSLISPRTGPVPNIALPPPVFAPSPRQLSQRSPTKRSPLSSPRSMSAHQFPPPPACISPKQHTSPRITSPTASNPSFTLTPLSPTSSISSSPSLLSPRSSTPTSSPKTHHHHADPNADILSPEILTPRNGLISQSEHERGIESPQRAPDYDAKILRRAERGDPNMHCIKDSQLVNGANRKFIEDIPPIIPNIEERDGLSFAEYAQKHFEEQVQKKQFSKKAVTKEALITYSKKLTSSLHRLESRESQKAALDMFERIQSLMGDSKKPEKSVSGSTGADGLLSQFLDFVLKKPDLHNECYAQLIKQLSSNPKRESMVKGWHVMACVVSTFPPATPEMVECVAYWLLNQAFNNPNPCWFSLQTLQKSVAAPFPRKHAPGLHEINFLKNFAPILCRFSTMDDAKKAILVDSFTTLSQTIQTVFARAQLPFAYRDLFSCVIISPDGAHKEVPSSSRVVDVLKSIEIAYPNITPPDSLLFLKQTIYLNITQPIDHDLLIKLSFHQLKSGIHSGALPCTAKQVIELAALEMQTIGDYDESKKTVINTTDMIPGSLLSTQPVEVWTRKIGEAQFSMTGTSPVDCMRKYTHLCQTLPLYGVTVFDVEVTNISSWKVFEERTNKLLLSEEGVLFTKRDLVTKVFHIQYNDIVRWKYIQENAQLELQIANYTSMLRLESKPSNEYFTIMRLLSGYTMSMLRRSTLAVAVEDHIFDASDPGNFDLLPFVKGDLLKIHVPNDGNDWEFGSTSDGHLGNFPSSLIRRTWSTAVYDKLEPSVAVTLKYDALPINEDVKPLLIEYAKARFRTKKLENNYLLDLESRMVYSDQPLTHSLLKLNTNDNRQAVEIFSLLLKYYQNPKKIKPYSDAVAKASENSHLRDEFYCQIFKQTLGNLDQKSNRLSWEILTMTTLAFSPSDKKLLEILEMFLDQQGINDPDQHVVCLARHALLQLSRRRSSGNRLELPSVKEYEAIKLGSYYLSVKVQTLISNPMILIDSCSSASEVATSVACNQFRLPESDLTKVFGIGFINERGVLVALPPIIKLVDSIIQRERAGAKTPVQFEFTVLIWYFSNLDIPQLDDKTIDLLYFIMRDRVLTFDINCPLQDAVLLAGLMFNASNLETPHKLNLHEYVSKYILSKNTPELLIQRIASSGELQTSDSAQRDARVEFIKTAISLAKHWFWTLFPVYGKEKKVVVVNLGISVFGIAVFKYETDHWKIKDSWTFSQITSCVSDSNSVTLTIERDLRKCFNIDATDTFKYCYQQYKIRANELNAILVQ